MATYAQLKKQMEKLGKQAEAALRAEKNAVLTKVREAVSSFSLSVEEVFGGSGKKNAKATGAKRIPKGAGQAKYADPKTGATWSGFGRAPAWIASAKDRTKFLVNKAAASEAPTQSKAVKPATKPKAAAKKTKSPVATTAVKASKSAEGTVKKAVKAASKAKAVTQQKVISKASAPAKAAASKAKTPTPRAAAAGQTTTPAPTAAA